MNIKSFDSFFSKLKHKNVYVGFSGGADSRAIIELANSFRNKYHFNLKAINFEHGIRGQESIDDTSFCIKVCNDYDIPIEVISLNLDKDTPNLECVAREKRLEYYKTFAEKDNNHIILLGHHLDDKIENFFIRMSRGSNMTGLSSLKEYTYIDDIYIGRPLIYYSKKEIIDFMNDNHLEYRTDSTNLSNDYNRNYLRNSLLKEWFNKFSFVKGGIIKSMENIEKDNDFIENYADEKFNEVYKNYKLNIPVHINYYLQLHEAIRFRVLKKHIQLYIKDFEMKGGFMKSFNMMIKSYDNTDHKTLRVDDGYNLVIKGYKIYLEKTV